MMKYKLQNTYFKTQKIRTHVLFCVLVFMSFVSFAQIKASTDVDTIKIGEQITYKVEVESNASDVVIFPEGQTFGALEMIESYAVDTTKNASKLNLIKKYGLTKFDSGAYTIPKQKIIINTKPFFTDSLRVEVREVVVDTTKQGLYNVKPIIAVEKSVGDWWKYLLGVILLFALAGFLIWWFLWREKKLSKEEQIAMLPAYDRAKLALKQLDETSYLQNENLKEYYSELTFIIRKYLDEKVYDKALESTTDELVSRLNVLKKANQIELSQDDIRNIETILKRADLVKFAKSAPDVALAQLDRNTIAVEIDNVKEALPEPTEEEKLLNKQYKEEKDRRKKRKKIIFTALIAAFLFFATLIGFAVKFGYDYLKENVFGYDSKDLLEKEWVTSDYGVSPITISTPMVLKRQNIDEKRPENSQVKIGVFQYGTPLSPFSFGLNSTVLPNQQRNAQSQKQADTPQIDLLKSANGALKGMEANGAKDIVVQQDKFKTPNGAEGLKVYGTLNAPIAPGSDQLRASKFNMVLFTAGNTFQQVVITSPDNDKEADKVVARILDSIEVKPTED